MRVGAFADDFALSAGAHGSEQVDAVDAFFAVRPVDLELLVQQVLEAELQAHTVRRIERVDEVQRVERLLIGVGRAVTAGKKQPVVTVAVTTAGQALYNCCAREAYWLPVRPMFPIPQAVITTMLFY